MEKEVLKSPKGRQMIIHKHNGRIVSRQRAYQIQQIEQGLCMYCPQESVVKGYCQKHLEVKRKRQARWYQNKKARKTLQKV